MDARTDDARGLEDARRLAGAAGGLYFCHGVIDGWCGQGHRHLREVERCLSKFRTSHGNRSDRLAHRVAGERVPLTLLNLRGTFDEAGAGQGVLNTPKARGDSLSDAVTARNLPAKTWNDKHPPGTRVRYRGKETHTIGRAFINTWYECRVLVAGTLDQPLVAELEVIDQLALPLDAAEASGAQHQET